MSTKAEATKKKHLEAIKKEREGLQKRCQKMTGHHANHSSMIQAGPVCEYYKLRIRMLYTFVTCVFCGKTLYAEKVANADIPFHTTYISSDNYALKDIDKKYFES